ncbi:MAG: sugar transferase [Ardenticatenales bacterium]
MPAPPPKPVAEDVERVRRRRRFALGLLAYAVVTIALFSLVFRYLQVLVDFYGGNIKNAWLQYSLLFAIYFVFVAGLDWAMGWVPIRVRREPRLQATLVGGFTLAAIVALFQSKYGVDLQVGLDRGILYLFVGVLGAYAGALAATWRAYGLVEVIAPPPPDIVRAVEAAHAHVLPARRPWDRVKRAIDASAALTILIVSLPISIPLTMVLWWQDPGPLLVAKVAVRQAGRSFRQLKLRTMVKNAEAATGPVPASPADARVTRLGGVLRRTHIDELPQMLNIALGQMSLVGPRPERTVFVARHVVNIPGYAQRHAVPPGLAGMAQVYGDYYSTPREKLRYDRLYIKKRGPALDLHLFLTAVALAFLGVRPGARQRRRERARLRVQEGRYGRAYEALRGERVDGGDKE